MSRIVLASWGSLGDLHPYIAAAIALRARGHDVTLATCEMYRAKVEGEGIRFHPYSPDLARWMNDAEALRRSYDLKTGTEYVLREMVLPSVEESYTDLRAACANADLIVAHPLTYAVPIVARQFGIRWLSVVLQPVGFMSEYDPPYFPRARWAFALRRFGRWPYALLFRMMKTVSIPWAKPIVDLRRKLGMEIPAGNPLIDGMISPYGTMAWFSPLLAVPQPDWPPGTRVTGFPFYDKLEPDAALSPDIEAFLRAGDPPIVFTLGSSAVMEAGDFYQQSADAVERLGRRAILLVGRDARNMPDNMPHSTSAGILTAEYAPYSELFPRAIAVVHQGGIGTVGQTLRAGRPMLVVPFSHDQPDNALRVARLGVGRALPRARYSAKRVATELKALLDTPSYSMRAAEVGRIVCAEDGATALCNFIETALMRAL